MMFSIEDTERLIAAMRAQARNLEDGATALEAALAPMKVAMSAMETMGAATKAMMDLWIGAAMPRGERPGDQDR